MIKFSESILSVWVWFVFGCSVWLFLCWTDTFNQIMILSSPATSLSSVSIFHAAVSSCLVRFTCILLPTNTTGYINLQIIRILTIFHDFRNIQQVKRSIAAKEISDHAFLSCTPTSALRNHENSINNSFTSVTTHRMRNYRQQSKLFSTIISVFVLVDGFSPYPVLCFFWAGFPIFSADICQKTKCC